MPRVSLPDTRTDSTAAPAAASAPPLPLISVIVPHLDDVERLARCIAALEAQTLPRDRFEIIVADNGSRCGLAEVASTVGSARIVAVTERGAGPARNAAAAVARGALLAFTDSDCIPDRNWLDAGIAALAGADLAGGAVRVDIGDRQQPCPAEAFELVFAFDNQRYVERLGFSVTANLFARRHVYDTVGGFKIGVPEDLDWCRRAHAAGFRLHYSPGAVVVHPARDSFAALARKWQRLTDEAYVQWRATGRSRATWLLRAAATLASPVAHAGRIIASRRLESVASRAAALGVLVGIRALRAWWMLRQVLAETTGKAAIRPVPSVQ